MSRPSLRSVLLVSIGGVAMGAVVLTALLVLGLARLGAERRALAALGREADGVVDIAADLPCADNRPRRMAAALRELGPRVRFVPETARGPLAELGIGEGRTTFRGRQLLYAARPTSLCAQPGTLVVLRDAADTPLLPDGSAGRFLFAAAVSLIGAAAVAYVLARRISRPLRELAVSARDLRRGDTAVADPHPSDPAEVAELRAAFADMAAGLKSSREREESFLLSVSHELKTPLTAIRGYGEALSDGTARGAKSAGDVIVHESARLERLVQDLIDLARLRAGEFSVEAEEVELDVLCDSVVRALLPSAREAGVRLESRADGTVRVRTDPDRVHQMIANLVENALRVTPQGGTISVEVGARTVRVTDSGPGLEADDIRHAFERFYLWRRYRGVRPVGTGLGLAIVGELATVLGITIGVESEPESGTAFTLRFDA